MAQPERPPMYHPALYDAVKTSLNPTIPFLILAKRDNNDIITTRQFFFYRLSTVLDPGRCSEDKRL